MTEGAVQWVRSISRTVVLEKSKTCQHGGFFIARRFCLENAKKNTKKQYVYAITSESAVKFGISSSPATRLVACQTGCPLKLELAGCVEGDLILESGLHAFLKNYRIRGEWFTRTEFTDSIVDLFRSGDRDKIYEAVGEIPPHQRSRNKSWITKSKMVQYCVEWETDGGEIYNDFLTANSQAEAEELVWGLAEKEGVSLIYVEATTLH